MLEFRILNFDFSLTALYIVVGALWYVYFVVLFLVNIIIEKKMHHIKLTASGKVILGKVLK